MRYAYLCLKRIGNIDVRVRVRAHMCVSVRACMCVCWGIRTYVCMSEHMHIHTHTHKHKHPYVIVWRSVPRWHIVENNEYRVFRIVENIRCFRPYSSPLPYIRCVRQHFRYSLFSTICAVTHLYVCYDSCAMTRSRVGYVFEALCHDELRVFFETICTVRVPWLIHECDITQYSNNKCAMLSWQWYQYTALSAKTSVWHWYEYRALSAKTSVWHWY